MPDVRSVDEVESGGLNVHDENRLPDGLTGFFQKLLERAALSDLHGTLPAVLTTVVTLGEPVSEQVLVDLLVYRSELPSDATSHALLQRCLASAQHLLGHAPSPDGDPGFVAYLPSFHKYLQQTPHLENERRKTVSSLKGLAWGWEQLAEGPARRAVLRRGPRLLLDSGEPDKAARLLTSPRYLGIALSELPPDQAWVVIQTARDVADRTLSEGSLADALAAMAALVTARNTIWRDPLQNAAVLARLYGLPDALRLITSQQLPRHGALSLTARAIVAASRDDAETARAEADRILAKLAPTVPEPVRLRIADRLAHAFPLQVAQHLFSRDLHCDDDVLPPFRLTELLDRLLHILGLGELRRLAPTGWLMTLSRRLAGSGDRWREMPHALAACVASPGDGDRLAARISDPLLRRAVRAVLDSDLSEALAILQDRQCPLAVARFLVTTLLKPGRRDLLSLVGLREGDSQPDAVARFVARWLAPPPEDADPGARAEHLDQYERFLHLVRAVLSGLLDRGDTALASAILRGESRPVSRLNLLDDLLGDDEGHSGDDIVASNPRWAVAAAGEWALDPRTVQAVVRAVAAHDLDRALEYVDSLGQDSAETATLVGFALEAAPGGQRDRLRAIARDRLGWCSGRVSVPPGILRGQLWLADSMEERELLVGRYRAALTRRGWEDNLHLARVAWAWAEHRPPAMSAGDHGSEGFGLVCSAWWFKQAAELARATRPELAALARSASSLAEFLHSVGGWRDDLPPSLLLAWMSLDPSEMALTGFHGGPEVVALFFPPAIPDEISRVMRAGLAGSLRAGLYDDPSLAMATLIAALSAVGNPALALEYAGRAGRFEALASLVARWEDGALLLESRWLEQLPVGHRILAVARAAELQGGLQPSLPDVLVIGPVTEEEIRLVGLAVGRVAAWDAALARWVGNVPNRTELAGAILSLSGTGVLSDAVVRTSIEAAARLRFRTAHERTADVPEPLARIPAVLELGALAADAALAVPQEALEWSEMAWRLADALDADPYAYAFLRSQLIRGAAMSGSEVMLTRATRWALEHPDVAVECYDTVVWASERQVPGTAARLRSHLRGLYDEA